MPRSLATVLVLFLSQSATSCDGKSGPGPTPVESGVLVVYTVNYPLAYFAERIGGDSVRAEFPAPADEDPAFWKPDAPTRLAYQQADLVLLNGAGYAKWVPQTTLTPSRVVDTSASIHDRLIDVSETVTHSHGPEGDHSHSGTAFTTWLDPQQAVRQARAILEALRRLRPAQAGSFESRFQKLAAELTALDARLAAAVALNPELRLVVSHPVYQYWIRRYGLKAETVHWEPDSAPTEDQWKALATLLEKHPARWMIWEGTPLPESVRRLTEMGV